MLQRLLYTKVDGDFGKATDAALRAYQSRAGLVVDGACGPKTWLTLFTQEIAPIKDDYLKFLAEGDLENLAHELEVEVAAIKAVNEVESHGSGFVAGKVKILFEGHVFWKQLRKQGKDPRDHLSGNEDILYSKWTKDYYAGGLGEHDRLERARAIDEQAALESASYGLFQIMGFNHKMCAHRTVAQFVTAMEGHENAHLQAFGEYLVTRRLVGHLRSHNWAEFARRYNGPAYRENLYDEKLEAAYLDYKAREE